jgi:5-methylcytosine-specific restriction endonuclease McrA
MDSCYICKPKDNVTLILSHFWTPINITTAKEAMHKITSSGSCSDKNSKIKAISRSGEPLCLEDWNNPEKALYYEGQPFLRSANNIYPVPTILLTSANWSFRGHGRPSLSYLYNRLKGRCQICGEKMPYKYMSIEHIEPRSQGGTNDWFNITMTCKPCNSKKGSIFPYKSHEGKDLVAPVPLPFFHSFLRCRKEWDPFLFKKRS